MAARVRITTAVATVLAAFLTEPTADRYGLDLMGSTGLPSGTLYPLLMRLQRAGWLTAEWEQIDPMTAARPARRYYRLTPDGVVAARTELAVLHATLSRAGDPLGRPRPA
jgi:PadR family transcriptional regulator PadR